MQTLIFSAEINWKISENELVMDRGPTKVIINNAKFTGRLRFTVHGVLNFNNCFLGENEDIFEVDVYGSQYDHVPSDQWQNENVSSFNTVSFNRAINMYKSQVSLLILNIHIFRTSAKHSLVIVISNVVLSSSQLKTMRTHLCCFKLIMVHSQIQLYSFPKYF